MLSDGSYGPSCTAPTLASEQLPVIVRDQRSYGRVRPGKHRNDSGPIPIRWRKSVPCWMRSGLRTTASTRPLAITAPAIRSAAATSPSRT